MAAPDPTSRYAGLPEIRVVAPDGSIARARRPAGRARLRRCAAPTPFGPGDRLDLLAPIAAGDSTRWWLLADANPLADATRLERPGETIDLPDA